MISCTHKQSFNSFILTTQNHKSNNSNFKLVDIGTIAYYNAFTKAIQLSPKHNFGFTIEKNVKPKTYYHLQLKVHSKNYSVNLATESNFYGWIGSHNPTFQDKSKEWYYINLFIKTPDTIKQGIMKIYAYNWTNDTAYVDSLKVTEYSEFPFQDSVPDFIFKPLTYNLLNELAFYGKNVSVENFLDLLDEDILFSVFDKQFIPKKEYIKELNRRTKKCKLNDIFDMIKQDANILKNPSVNTKPRETFETKLSGYTDKIIYTKGEQVTIKIQNAHQLNSVQLLQPIENYKFRKLMDIAVLNKENIIIETKDLSPNTYCIQLKDKQSVFNIPFIISSNQQSDIVLLAPVTTWHAYNYYGGKSFYVNTKDDSCVYTISTQRPLVSCTFDSILVGHDLFIFDNIYKFFFQNYQCNVYPDYYLDAHPELFKNAKTIIFAQHCEYFSTKMFNALAQFSKSKNIISLGGNQAYWKIRFSDNYQKIECRKDGTFFENTLIPAGLWRTSFSNEAKYLGNAYTDAGYETYCSYKVINAQHWLYKNCTIKNGDEFGKYGIDNRGLSGDEMDKVNDNTPKNSVLLAKGTNPDNGGGDILIIENKNNAILSFGSIACGIGLNKDKVFTQMTKNFLERYHKKQIQH